MKIKILVAIYFLLCHSLPVSDYTLVLLRSFQDQDQRPKTKTYRVHCMKNKINLLTAYTNQHLFQNIIFPNQWLYTGFVLLLKSFQDQHQRPKTKTYQVHCMKNKDNLLIAYTVALIRKFTVSKYHLPFIQLLNLKGVYLPI